MCVRKTFFIYDSNLDMNFLIVQLVRRGSLAFITEFSYSPCRRSEYAQHAKETDNRQWQLLLLLPTDSEREREREREWHNAIKGNQLRLTRTDCLSLSGQSPPLFLIAYTDWCAILRFWRGAGPITASCWRIELPAKALFSGIRIVFILSVSHSNIRIYSNVYHV